MYSIVPLLPEFEAGLLFDALDRSNRNLLFGVGYGDAARLCWVLKLLMTAGLCNFIPAVLCELFQDFPAVHDRALCP